MFSRSPQSILYLQAQALFVIGETGVLGQLLFPPEVAQYAEVHSLEGFTKLLQGFFTQTNENQVEKQTTVMILASDVLVQKMIPAGETPPTDFFERVPISPDYLAKKTFKFGDQKYLVAANKQLYE